jgi:2'-5' RNA ligase
MATIRAFIAAEIDPQTKKKISNLISILKKSEADVKWVTEDQMHLTLKFLGNIEQDRIQEISDALSAIANKAFSFTIHLSKLGAFPNMNHPRVIWIGIDKGAESLEALNKKIETNLEKLGFPKENREFKPHFTLARIKSSKNILELIKTLEKNTFDSEGEIKINKLIIFQSILTPKGAIYTKLSTAELAPISSTLRISPP